MLCFYFSDVMNTSSSDNYNNSPQWSDTRCFYSGPSSIIFITFMINHIVLLLPLCIPIVYSSLQKWRTRSSTCLSATSLSDCITCHSVIMEVIGIFGCLLCFFSSRGGSVTIFQTGQFLFIFTWYGEILFHVLMCFEQYLAVIHPVTYLSLKNVKWIRIRNVSICCVWLLCIMFTCLLGILRFFIPELCLMILALAFYLFCSFSVLRVLVRPGPGEQGENKKRVDQSKHRAFSTIVCILGVLMLKFITNMAMALLYLSNLNYECVIVAGMLWFNLPSSLLLPLLFLHREGKFMFKNNCFQ